MRPSLLRPLSVSLFLLLGSSACGHDWDALDPALAGGSSSAGTSGAAGSKAAGGGAGAAGSSSTGGSGNAGGGAGTAGASTGGGAGTAGASTGGGAGTAGGAGGCAAPLLPPVEACDMMRDDFDDPSTFNDHWTVTGGSMNVTPSNMALTVTLPAFSGTVFAENQELFGLDNCGVWTQIVTASQSAGVMTRLSIAESGAMSHYNIGVLDGKLSVGIGAQFPAQMPYDAATMKYVRIRETNGKVGFDTSADGRCWLEVYSTDNDLFGAEQARLALTHVTGTATGTGTFDNFCVTPP